MTDKQSGADHLDALEGADAAALGIDATPESAPPGAEVDADEQLVPGAVADDRARDEAKPWFTSLAADSAQAGVGNDPPDGEEPLFLPEDEPTR